MGRACGMRWCARAHAQTSMAGNNVRKSNSLFATDRCGWDASIQSTAGNHVRRGGGHTLSIFLGHPGFVGNRDEQIVPGHLLWLRHSKQKQKRWRDIGQNSVLAAKSRRIFGHINEMHEIGGVRSIWRAVG